MKRKILDIAAYLSMAILLGLFITWSVQGAEVETDEVLTVIEDSKVQRTVTVITTTKAVQETVYSLEDMDATIAELKKIRDDILTLKNARVANLQAKIATLGVRYTKDLAGIDAKITTHEALRARIAEKLLAK